MNQICLDQVRLIKIEHTRQLKELASQLITSEIIKQITAISETNNVGITYRDAARIITDEIKQELFNRIHIK